MQSWLPAALLSADFSAWSLIVNNQLQINPKLTPVKTEPEPKITRQEAEDAAKDAGLAVIRVKRLEASAKIGKFIDELGAKRIGRTTIVMAQEAIEEAIKQCDEAIRMLDGTDDPGPMIEIIRLKTGLTAQLLQAGNSMVKSEEISAPDSQVNQMRIPLPSGAKIAIVTPTAEIAKPDSE